MSHPRASSAYFADVSQSWRDNAAAILVRPPIPRSVRRGREPIERGSHKHILMNRHALASRLAAVRAYTLRELNEQTAKERNTETAAESLANSHAHDGRVRFRDTNWIAPVEAPKSNPGHTTPQKNWRADGVPYLDVYAQPNDMRGAVQVECKAGSEVRRTQFSPERFWESHMEYELISEEKMRWMDEIYRQHRMQCPKCMFRSVVDKIIPYHDKDRDFPMLER